MSFRQTLRSIFGGSDVDISGDWSGFYGFGENYSEFVRKQQIKFAAQIERRSGDNFVGLITEFENGIPEPAEISGILRGKEIQFTKTYKSTYQIDEKGILEKMAYGPHHVIYEGLFDQSNLRFYGEWRIEKIIVLEDGRRVERVSKGYWEMAKDRSNQI